MSNQNMTLWQALRRVKSLKGRLGEMSRRAAECVSYVEGHKPAFDFATSRLEAAKARRELVALEAAVATANALTTIEYDGRTITLAEAIRWLQEFKAEMAWLPSLDLKSGVVMGRELEYDEAAGRSVPRRVETTYVSDLSEVNRAAEIEALRANFERLNDALESANHQTKVRWSPPA